jgi:cation:H+ antiporter
MTLIMLFLGFGALISGAELLVRGASRLAAVFNVSPLIIGLTIVSMGTSSPELAVTINATLSNYPDLAIGNIVGSNIFNILFILGLSSLMTPMVVAQQLVWLDVPIMIATHFLFLTMSASGLIDRFDGLVLLACFISYTAFIIYKSRNEPPEVKDEYRIAFSVSLNGGKFLIIIKYLAYIVIGIFLCILGARWLGDSAVMLARTLGVSELVIGLTIVAAGTSMPEAATSIVAAIRGQRDIAIGNIVGSNIFNILGLIGVAGVIAPEGIVIPTSVLHFDLPVAIAASIACMPIFFFGHKITRWEGALFFGYYLAYTSYLVLDARQHDALPVFSMVMLWFVIPLTIVTMVIVYYRTRRRRV